MIRSTMAGLIAEVRRLTNTHAAHAALLTDQQIQDALDTYRREAHRLPLESLPTPISGVEEYRTWIAPDDHWEDSPTLYGPDGVTTITPAAADLINGRWTFDEHVAAVSLSGFSYDLHGPAADLLDAMAAGELFTFDFNTGPAGNFQRGQVRQRIVDQAAIYRRKARPIVAEWVRGDVTGAA